MSDLNTTTHSTASWDFDAAFKDLRHSYNTSSLSPTDVCTKSYELIDQSIATHTVDGFANVFKIVSYLEKNFDDNDHFSKSILSEKMDNFLDAAYDTVSTMICTAGEIPLFSPATYNPYKPIENMFYLMKDAFCCKEHLVDPMLKCGFNKTLYEEEFGKEFQINLLELERLEKSYHDKSVKYDESRRMSQITDDDKVRVMPLLLRTRQLAS